MLFMDVLNSPGARMSLSTASVPALQASASDLETRLSLAEEALATAKNELALVNKLPALSEKAWAHQAISATWVYGRSLVQLTEDLRGKEGTAIFRLGADGQSKESMSLIAALQREPAFHKALLRVQAATKELSASRTALETSLQLLRHASIGSQILENSSELTRLEACQWKLGVSRSNSMGVKELCSWVKRGTLQHDTLLYPATGAEAKEGPGDDLNSGSTNNGNGVRAQAVATAIQVVHQYEQQQARVAKLQAQQAQPCPQPQGLLAELVPPEGAGMECWCWESLGVVQGPFSTKCLLRWLQDKAITRWLLVFHKLRPDVQVFIRDIREYQDASLRRQQQQQRQREAAGVQQFSLQASSSQAAPQLAAAQPQQLPWSSKKAAAVGKILRIQLLNALRKHIINMVWSSGGRSSSQMDVWLSEWETKHRQKERESMAVAARVQEDMDRILGKGASSDVQPPARHSAGSSTPPATSPSGEQHAQASTSLPQPMQPRIWSMPEDGGGGDRDEASATMPPASATKTEQGIRSVVKGDGEGSPAQDASLAQEQGLALADCGTAGQLASPSAFRVAQLTGAAASWPRSWEARPFGQPTGDPRQREPRGSVSVTRGMQAAPPASFIPGLGGTLDAPSCSSAAKYSASAREALAATVQVQGHTLFGEHLPRDRTDAADAGLAGQALAESAANGAGRPLSPVEQKQLAGAAEAEVEASLQCPPDASLPANGNSEGTLPVKTPARAESIAARGYSDSPQSWAGGNRSSHATPSAARPSPAEASSSPLAAQQAKSCGPLPKLEEQQREQQRQLQLQQQQQLAHVQQLELRQQQQQQQEQQQQQQRRQEQQQVEQRQRQQQEQQQQQQRRKQEEDHRQQQQVQQQRQQEELEQKLKEEQQQQQQQRKKKAPVFRFAAAALTARKLKAEEEERIKQAEEDRLAAEQQARDEAKRKQEEEELQRQAEQLRQEQELKRQEAADRKLEVLKRFEATRLAEEEAEQEALRRAQEAEREALQKAQEEAEREAQRIAQEEAEQEAQWKAKEMAEQEAERKVKERAEREALRKAQKEAKQEAQRKAKEMAEQEAERKAQEVAEQEAQREAQEREELEATRQAKEKVEQEAWQKAQEREDRKAERKAQETKEREARCQAKERAQQEAKRRAQEKEEQKVEQRAKEMEGSRQPAGNEQLSPPDVKRQRCENAEGDGTTLEGMRRELLRLAEGGGTALPVRVPRRKAAEAADAALQLGASPASPPEEDKNLPGTRSLPSHTGRSVRATCRQAPDAGGKCPPRAGQPGRKRAGGTGAPAIAQPKGLGKSGRAGSARGQGSAEVETMESGCARLLPYDVFRREASAAAQRRVQAAKRITPAARRASPAVAVPGPAAAAPSAEAGPSSLSAAVSRRAGRAGPLSHLRTFGDASSVTDAAKWKNIAARTKKLKFGRSKLHGWGMFAAEVIEGEEFVMEYVGELIRVSMSDVRERQYRAARLDDYMFRIDYDWVVDATRKGGAARFVNHSCDPNCYTKVVVVDSIKHVCIYSKRRLEPGEELCYDYKFQYEEDVALKVPCNCGARNCSKWMC